MANAKFTFPVANTEVLNVADPTTAQSAATKAYVDARAGGGTPTLVEPSWRTVNRNTTTNTLTVTDNAQPSNYVFRGELPTYTSVTNLPISSTGEPAATGPDATFSLAVIGGTLNGVISPSPLAASVPVGLTLGQYLQSSGFQSTFLSNPSLWVFSFTSPNVIVATYNGSGPAITSGTPTMEASFSGSWSNSPTASGPIMVTQTANNQPPAFGTLRSEHVTPAINGTPTANQVVGWDATNTRLNWQASPITSINTQTGPAISVAAGTGIGIATSNNTITVTNTGSGSIASGNFTSFNAVVQRTGQSTQFSPPTAFIANSALDQAGIYVDITGGGWLNETNTLLDGGAIGNTTYITTATRSGTNGLIFPVSTTYGEVECQLFSQNLTLNVTYNSAGGTLGSVRVEAYFALRGLNASSSQAPYQSTAVFPPFSFAGNDGVTFLYVVQPVYTFTNTGTGSATLTIPAAQFRAISPQYTGLGGTNEYIPYLRVLLFNTATNPAPLLPTSASVASYSALPSMRVVLTLPGVGGSPQPLQMTLNTGNTATNTTGNVSTIILNDSVSGSATTVDGTKVESRLHQFDGATSGNVKITASPTTTTYPLVLPASQGTANTSLINDGSGNLSWGVNGIIAYDVITWTNSGSLYSSDRTIPIQTVNGTIGTTFITLASTLTGFAQNAAVVGVTSTGASVSGFFQTVAGIPSVQSINVDRGSGLVTGNTYTFSWRQGRLGTAGNYIDTAAGSAGIGTSVFFNELGYSGAGVSVTADAVNIGRYLLNITPTLNNILGNDNRTAGRNLIISQADQIRFQDTTQPTPNYVSLKAPASALTTNVNLTLPTALPASTLPLVSDSSGNLSFATGLALTTGSVANAPVNPTDIARLQEVTAAQAGFKIITGVNTWISETLIAGTYTNASGVLGMGQWVGTSMLTVSGGNPATGDTVVLIAQGGSISTAAVGNGSFTVISNTASGYQLNRLAVPAFGNFYLSVSGSNAGLQVENITTGTITATTPLLFGIFGLPNNATPTLSQVLLVPNSKNVTNAAATGLTWGSDNTIPVQYISSGSGGLALSWRGSTPTQIFGNATGVFNINAVNALVFPTSATDGLFISNTTIKRNATGNLSILAGTNSGDSVILGTNNTNTVNNIAIFSATAGSGATITAQGTDSNIPLVLTGKGTSGITLGSNLVNYISVTPKASGANPAIAVVSSDANAGIDLNPQGVNGSINIGTNYQNYAIIYPTAGTNPVLLSVGSSLSDAGLQISPKGAGDIILGQVNTNSGIRIVGGLGGTTARIIAASNALSVANTDLQIQAKGTGVIQTGSLLQVVNGASFNSGSALTPAYASQLLAADKPVPTAITAGSIGSQLISRGASASPYWFKPGNYESTYTSTTVIAGGVNTIVIFPTAGTNLNALSYNTATGLFTAQRACYVIFSFDAILTSINTATVTEGDIWLSKNGTATTGTRYGQVNFNLGAGAVQGSQILNLTQPISLASGDTIYCYAWCSGSFVLGGTAFGGVQTRLVVVELAQF